MTSPGGNIEPRRSPRSLQELAWPDVGTEAGIELASTYGAVAAVLAAWVFVFMVVGLLEGSRNGLMMAVLALLVLALTGLLCRYVYKRNAVAGWLAVACAAFWILIAMANSGDLSAWQLFGVWAYLALTLYGCIQGLRAVHARPGPPPVPAGYPAPPPVRSPTPPPIPPAAGAASAKAVAVSRALAEILARHGRDPLLQDIRRFEALLRDYCAHADREIDVLIRTLRKGIPQRLLGRPSANLSEGMLSGLASRLSDETGLREDVARWGVETWAGALGLRGLEPPPVVYCIRCGAANPQGAIACGKCGLDLTVAATPSAGPARDAPPRPR